MMRGSDNYWRNKRYEVESWVNYHVENGNRPPSMFITLSCAKNWWKDLQLLLQDRLKTTKHKYLINDMNSQIDKIKMSARSKVTTLYSILVQEFFQIRTDYWLKTVGKTILDIEHYWGRFEFAKGRGQIHLHLLAITKNRHHQKEYWKQLNIGNKQEAIDVMVRYAKQIGLIANHPGVKENENIINHKKVRIKFQRLIFLYLFSTI